MLTVRAPAKVNLALEVLGERADGYHEIRSIIQTIDLCDTLEFAPADKLLFDCTAEALRGPDNLVVRVVYLLAEAAGVKPGVRVLLRKRIPWGMGLGGGSSDAAACLIGLNQLWRLDRSIGQLVELGLRLGSDVPFFLYGGTCLVEGRGERVIPIPEPTQEWIVLAFPPAADMPGKTKRMYGALRPADFSDGGRTEALRRRLVDHRPVKPDMLVNAFEKAAPELFPGLSDIWRKFEEIAGSRVQLCGSGPALFSLQTTKAAAEMVARRLRSQGTEAVAVSLLGRTDAAPCSGTAGGRP